MHIASILRDGSHDHLFLTLIAANLLTQTVTAYISQVTPSSSPIHQANSIGPQISETIRKWTKDHRTFKITQEMGQEFHIQVTASTPAAYLRRHYSATLGWENVIIQDMFTALCNNYGTITAT